MNTNNLLHEGDSIITNKERLTKNFRNVSAVLLFVYILKGDSTAYEAMLLDIPWFSIRLV